MEDKAETLILILSLPSAERKRGGEGGRLHTPVQSIYKPERDREGRGRTDADADATEGDCARAPFAARDRERAAAGVREGGGREVGKVRHYEIITYRNKNRVCIEIEKELLDRRSV